MKKIISILILMLTVSLICGTMYVYAEDSGDAGLNGIISGMANASKISEDDVDTGIGETINDVIGLLQLAGTGIAVIVTTMLGIKYLIASPSEKADTKKQIFPILTGCILLFGAVNLVALVADFTVVLDAGSGS